MVHTFNPTLLLAWRLIFGVALIYAVVDLVFINYISRLNKQAESGNLGGPISRVDRLRGIAFLLPRTSRRLVYFHLMSWCLLDRQYQRSVDNAIQLEKLRPPAFMAIEMHRRKSECFEALGQTDEARQEMERASAVVATSSADFAKFMSQGSLLNKQQRYSEAYDVFATALSIAPPGMRPVRDQLLGHLMTSAHLAGRPRDILPHADMLLNESKDPRYICIAYRMAAVGASDSNELPRAEQYAWAGIQYAQQQNRQSDYLQLLSYYGTLISRRPDPDAAMPVFDEAIAADTRNETQARFNKGEALLLVGRFAEGIAEIDRAREYVRQPLPSAQKRMTAIHQMAAARGYLLMGDGESAVNRMDTAAPDLTDEKLSVWCLAEYSWAFALSGRTTEAAANIEAVHQRRHNLPNDNTLQQTCLSYTARAALALGNIARADAFMDEYLSRDPKLSDLPMALFLKGECARLKGDTETARDFYNRAAAIHPSLYYCRQALNRL